MTLRSSSFLLCLSLTLSWVRESFAQTEFQRVTHLYVERESGPLHLDLRIPDAVASSPGVVFVHGGGFQMGTRDSAPVTQFLDALSAAGIPSASISYRLSMKGRGFGCDVSLADKRRAVALAGEDLEDALTWLEGQSHRDDWPTSWVAAGSSAGAETALWSGYVHAPERWAGVLSFSGALDASTLPLSTAPPLLAVHGQCDALVPVGADLHHFCPENSPGAWPLIGGPAWADSLRSVAVPASTWIQCGGSHRVCTSALSNPAVVDRVIQWLLTGGDEEWDVLVDEVGRPVQSGRSSCPQPCN